MVHIIFGCVLYSDNYSMLLFCAPIYCDVLLDVINIIHLLHNYHNCYNPQSNAFAFILFSIWSAICFDGLISKDSENAVCCGCQCSCIYVL